MRRSIKSLLLVGLGVLLAFPVFSMTYYTMVRTSTPGFCASCHEIEPAFNAWTTSTHRNNAQGLVADCMDCHLPAPHDTVDFFYNKTLHGMKDVAAHVLHGPEGYDRAENRLKAYASIKDDQCLKCHRNITNIPNNRGAMLAHRAALYPAEGESRKCTDCHRNLVHVDRAIYAYKQYAPPYRATGLTTLGVPGAL
ncbi:NapC/NirT family cytochrome c [Desulfovibrio aminophilus]|uniref:cytochrome c3 family protein n=1 Tax=Desulfovibrio aminophilus TaxID=81425 RepID=UPI00339B30FD